MGRQPHICSCLKSSQLIITKGREHMDCKASKPCLLVIDGDYFGKHALQGEAFLSFSILLFSIFKKKKIV